MKRRLRVSEPAGSLHVSLSFLINADPTDWELVLNHLKTKHGLFYIVQGAAEPTDTFQVVIDNIW